MNLDTFAIFSVVHLLAVASCVLISTMFVIFGCRWRSSSHRSRLIRLGIVTGCLVSWVASTVFWFHPAYFRWDVALPLQFCNLANLLGAIAVGRQIRTAQSLLYFWSFGLCLWAFVTPSLDVGPTHIWFWIFWGYHLFILISIAHVLIVDRFRPGWKDFRQAVLLTFAFSIFLTVLNAISGWNYGFLGAGSPVNPSPVDVLGPYPLRILWMLLIGIGVFGVLLIPWRLRDALSRSET